MMRGIWKIGYNEVMLVKTDLLSIVFNSVSLTTEMLSPAKADDKSKGFLHKKDTKKKQCNKYCQNRKSSENKGKGIKT
jgi:hypothetical protein